MDCRLCSCKDVGFEKYVWWGEIERVVRKEEEKLDEQSLKMESRQVRPLGCACVDLETNPDRRHQPQIAPL
jgi:hypothetical protein